MGKLTQLLVDFSVDVGTFITRNASVFAYYANVYSVLLFCLYTSKHPHIASISNFCRCVGKNTKGFPRFRSNEFQITFFQCGCYLAYVSIKEIHQKYQGQGDMPGFLASKLQISQSPSVPILLFSLSGFDNNSQDVALRSQPFYIMATLKVHGQRCAGADLFDVSRLWP